MPLRRGSAGDCLCRPFPLVGEARILEAWDAGGDDAAAAVFLVLPDGLLGLQAFEDVDIAPFYEDLKVLAPSRD